MPFFLQAANTRSPAAATSGGTGGSASGHCGLFVILHKSPKLKIPIDK